MTLQNLKEALYQNNLILLAKIKKLEDNTMQEVTDEEIQQAITDTLKILKEEKRHDT